MAEKISYTGQEETDFVEEDPRGEVIRDLTDPDEIKAAQELLEEKYDESPDGGTSSGKPEPKPEESGEDTSGDKPTDKTVESNEGKKPEESEAKKQTPPAEDGKKPEEKTDPPAEGEFKLTQEMIDAQPKSNQDILSKYKDKSKSEIAKAAANAIAMKNDYLEDNEKAIEGIAEKLEALPEADLLDQLLLTQRQTGVNPDIQLDNEMEVELPELPEDDPQIQEIVDQQVIKRMKKLYPDFPDDLNGPGYLEFEREIQDEKGQKGVNKLISDMQTASGEIGNDLKSYLYAQKNLNNLYVESPTDVFNHLNDYSVGQLKNINDNFVTLNNNALTDNVKIIEKELQKADLTLADIGVDLKLEPDENGSLFNDTLHSLLFKGENQLDGELTQRLGKIVLLKGDKLAQKFLNANNMKILSAIKNKSVSRDSLERERLKDENLNNLTAGAGSGSKATTETTDVTKITDPAELKRIQESIESKY